MPYYNRFVDVYVNRSRSRNRLPSCLQYCLLLLIILIMVQCIFVIMPWCDSNAVGIIAVHLSL